MPNAVSPPLCDFVFGGARSGKTALALAWAEASGRRPVMVATAEAWDAEMAARIAAHRAERDGRWRTVEAPLELVAALRTAAAPESIVVVDCLTLWLSNLLLAERSVEAEIDGLVAELGRCAGPTILVSNEVGLGIVPENALARRFRDLQGRLNRQVAAVADRVTFVAAGLSLRLKPGPETP